MSTAKPTTTGPATPLVPASHSGRNESGQSRWRPYPIRIATISMIGGIRAMATMRARLAPVVAPEFMDT